MEVFLERLVIELLFIAAQLAVLRLVAWLKARSADGGLRIPLLAS